MCEIDPKHALVKEHSGRPGEATEVSLQRSVEEASVRADSNRDAACSLACDAQRPEGRENSRASLHVGNIAASQQHFGVRLIAP